MGYQLPVFNEYITKYSAEVHVIHWDHKKLTPYKADNINKLFYYKRSDFSNKDLKNFVFNLSPNIVYISGWMDKGYLLSVRILKKKGVPIITGFDDIWWKTLKQRLASLIFPFIKNYFFSHAWVAGPYQYEFAKRLGFKNEEIIFNCLSADIKTYNNAFNIFKEKKHNKYPHRFLFVGRFEKRKGLDLLIKVWERINKKDWELYFIGNGTLYQYILNNKDIRVIDFLQPEELVKEIERFGCFILPSRFEPWALVLHEFSAAGLPIICSDICGAVPLFVTSGYNGYVFKSGNVNDLESQMEKIINSTDDELNAMSVKSHLMGQRITPEFVASSFISVLNKS